MASDIASRLARAIDMRGLASLLVSGGRSPVKLFEQLRVQALDWSRVCVALADERWVDATDAGSNEKLVRDVLLQDKAAAARFLGLKNAATLARSRRGFGLGDVCARTAAIRRDGTRHGR